MWAGRAIPKRSTCKYTAQQFGNNSVIEFIVLFIVFTGCVALLCWHTCMVGFEI
jgi:hypothetical protein